MIEKDKFIERQEGIYEIPLAYSRPILLFGEHAKGEFRVPLATTERGLVAGINRGCKAVKEAGGVTVRIFAKGMTRAPGFVGVNIEEVVKTYRWVSEHRNEMIAWPEARSKHIRLIDVRPFLIGRNLIVRLKYDCGDAMGGNSVTILSDRVSRRLAKEQRLEYLTISSNMCSDKKPSAINALDNRGFGIVAGLVLSTEVIHDILKTTPEKLLRLANAKLYVGSAFAGAPYHQNSHVANILAAIFIACGQDVAQIVESSLGNLTIEIMEKGSVYTTLTLPSLEVGVHGGGTEFRAARKELYRLECQPLINSPGQAAARFAEIVASVCLAGEISLLAVLAEGSLAEVSAHLGRGQA